jgi:hypothetical protein
MRPDAILLAGILASLPFLSATPATAWDRQVR